MKFENDELLHEFVITIPRNNPDVQEGENSNKVEEPSSANEELSSVYVEQKRYKFSKNELTGKQKDIINFCSVPRSASEIMERLGITNQTRHKAKYILPLVDAGFLKLTHPESPTAPNQKYVKVK